MEGIRLQESRGMAGAPENWSGVVAAHPVSWMETVAKRVEGLRLESLAGGAGQAQRSYESSEGAERYGVAGLDRGVGRRAQQGVSAGETDVDMAAAGQSLDGPEGLAGLIHDARNMVTAIELYCELLAEPGVLAEGYERFAGELRSVSASSRRLLERLAGMEGESRRAELRRERERVATSGPWLVYSAQQLANEAQLTVCAAEAASEPEAEALARPARMGGFEGGAVTSLANELEANRPLLGAVAGHGVTVGISIAGGHLPAEMACEDLTRVLVNLTKNAAEVMPDGGHLQISLEETDRAVQLRFTDSGTGIAPEVAERIFLPGYTTHIPLGAREEWEDEDEFTEDGWSIPHRGLGLAIVRSLVSAAHGRVWAANREDGEGAVFTVEFPCSLRSEGMG